MSIAALTTARWAGMKTQNNVLIKKIFIFCLQEV